MQLHSHFCFLFCGSVQREQVKMHLFVVSVLLVFGIPCTMTKLVDSFSTCPDFFSEKTPPVIPGILEDSGSKDQNRYKLICQEYPKDIYRFATLYDKKHKIPVFSAYKYTGKGDFRRPNNDFRIEPEVMFLTLFFFVSKCISVKA